MNVAQCTTAPHLYFDLDPDNDKHHSFNTVQIYKTSQSREEILESRYDTKA